MDLFDLLEPPCSECALLGNAIDSGIRYCHGALVWRWATDRVQGCEARKPIPTEPSQQ